MEAGEDEETRSRLAALVHESLATRVLRYQDLPAGLGSRRFVRLSLARDEPASVIARIEGPEDPAIRPAGIPPEPALEPLRTFLEDAGLPVPRRFGADPAGGIELLEDCGDRSLEHAAADATPEQRVALYREAVSLVPRLQRLSASAEAVPAFGRRLDSALFRYKAEEFIARALPHGLGRTASAGEAEAVRAAFEQIAREAAEAPQRLAHRDFKAANLHVRDAAPEAVRLVMIDLQGALMAPPEYDLVCLLRDAHVSLPDDEVRAHLESVRASLPDAPETGIFERRFTLLTLTRVGKDVARFLYAAHERRDERYRRLVSEGHRTLADAARRAAGWSPELHRLAEIVASLRDHACAP